MLTFFSMLQIVLVLSYCKMDFSVDEYLVFSCLKTWYITVHSLPCVRMYFYFSLPNKYLKIIQIRVFATSSLWSSVWFISCQKGCNWEVRKWGGIKSADRTSAFDTCKSKKQRWWFHHMNPFCLYECIYMHRESPQNSPEIRKLCTLVFLI